jgi:hypothetical protein
MTIDEVEYSELLGFGLCPSYGIRKNYKTQRFGNWICCIHWTLISGD